MFNDHTEVLDKNKETNYKPMATKANSLDMQVCVPKDWNDKKVKVFADKENPCGTENGWVIRKQGDKLSTGQPERVPCSKQDQYVHIMLDA